jgi:hypothetical protein
LAATEVNLFENQDGTRIK